MTEKIFVTEKACTICKEVKPRAEYYSHNKRRDGLQTACVSCVKRTNKEKYESDKEAWHYVRRDNALRVKFGIGLDEWLTMYEAQGRVCAICKSQRTKRQLHVDHCHRTGKVRALLCGKCNAGIGYFDENAEWLRAAAEYVEEHNVGADNSGM